MWYIMWCYFEEYLDYANCKCRKKVIDKLFEECSKNIDGNQMISVTVNDYKTVCGSCASIFHNKHKH